MGKMRRGMAPGLRGRYLRQGYLLVEGVFGAGKVAEALRALEDVPGWIRARRHRDIQRAQPLHTCPAVRDPAWLERLYDTPRLEAIIEEVFGGAIVPTPNMARDLKLAGLLIEPLDRWWSTGLHRDYRDFIANLDMDAWKAGAGDLRLFNQVNIPLLPDRCFWPCRVPTRAATPGRRRAWWPRDCVTAARPAGTRGRPAPAGAAGNC